MTLLSCRWWDWGSEWPSPFYLAWGYAAPSVFIKKYMWTDEQPARTSILTERVPLYSLFLISPKFVFLPFRHLWVFSWTCPTPHPQRGWKDHIIPHLRGSPQQQPWEADKTGIIISMLQMRKHRLLGTELCTLTLSNLEHHYVWREGL